METKKTTDSEEFRFKQEQMRSISQRTLSELKKRLEASTFLSPSQFMEILNQVLLFPGSRLGTKLKKLAKCKTTHEFLESICEPQQALDEHVFPMILLIGDEVDEYDGLFLEAKFEMIDTAFLAEISSTPRIINMSEAQLNMEIFLSKNKPAKWVPLLPQMYKYYEAIRYRSTPQARFSYFRTDPPLIFELAAKIDSAVIPHINFSIRELNEQQFISLTQYFKLYLLYWYQSLHYTKNKSITDRINDISPKPKNWGSPVSQEAAIAIGSFVGGFMAFATFVITNPSFEKLFNNQQLIESLHQTHVDTSFKHSSEPSEFMYQDQIQEIQTQILYLTEKYNNDTTQDLDQTEAYQEYKTGLETIRGSLEIKMNSGLLDGEVLTKELQQTFMFFDETGMPVSVYQELNRQ
jgi:hypothetical protein